MVSVLGRINRFYWTDVRFCIKAFHHIARGLVARRGLKLSWLCFSGPPNKEEPCPALCAPRSEADPCRRSIHAISVQPEKHLDLVTAHEIALPAIIFVLQCRNVWSKSVCANFLRWSRVKGQGYHSNSGTELLCLFCVLATSMATRWPLNGHTMATQWPLVKTNGFYKSLHFRSDDHFF